MTDFDAASALLMLSSGYQQYKNENNNIRTVLKTVNSTTANNSSAASSPVKKRERKNGSPKQRITAVSQSPPFSIAAVHENVSQKELFVRLIDSGMQKKKNTRTTSIRMDSSSPEMEKWDSSGSTLSPTLELHQNVTSTARNVPSMLYASPDMNGFALMLKSNGNQYTSSPDIPSGVVGGGMLSKGSNKKRFLDNDLVDEEDEDEGAIAMVVTADKPARSPSDSGVSSILDELQRPVLQRWSAGDRGEIDTAVPASVQMELDKINEISAYNKDIYTKSKLACFPLEMTFNPAKSRIRKKCSNEIDDQERIKNNEASRRSRHKKKLITHMLNINLEFDRMENRKLYMEERRLTDIIMELEEKALNRGIDAQVVQHLRSSCGFQ
ncbi:uncharacterized protein LOC126564857 [Anopheles maculipalpis]|uniref:uncharacterized protein LOC126564857 n=1 Tax=Anopheles maculipalpis TaxID=1496333 RepID=UPI002158B2DC|nr:uncharacterized protein LOC126564857 [Anopheles maculipalpis]